MKKILEVLETSSGELKFHTDVDVKRNPAAVMDVASSAVFTMATKLWGGQEDSVIAVIRALFVQIWLLASTAKQSYRVWGMRPKEWHRCSMK